MLASAMEVSCGRYIAEAGACSYLGEELKLIHARKAYLLAGRHALDAALQKAEASLRAQQIDFTVGVFEGYCTYDNARKHAECMRQAGCDCIVGMGGGKCLDTAKAVSVMTGLPLGNIPTQVATCVACTNMAIMYENSGAFLAPLYPERPIAFVLADLDILLQAPVRYIASGIVDSLAKYPELHFSQRGANDCAEVDDAAAQAAHCMAMSTWNVLMANGRKAYADNREHRMSNELSAVVNTNLITTGVISGLARGSKQLAIAHAVYNCSTTVFPEVWRGFLHGEIVSVGVLLQELYNEAPQAEIEKFISIARDLGVPVTLRDLGISGTAAELDRLHEAIVRDFTEFGPEERKRLREAMDRIVVL